MAHQLTIRQDGSVEMFSGRNITPWHKLGQIVEGTVTAKEAIKHAKLDWQVEIAPLFAKGKEVENHFGIVRNDNNLALGVVGKRYNPIQNSEAFEFFDEVVGQNSAYYDTAGSLFGGKRVFISAKIPGNLFVSNNPNDTLEKYVLLYTSHDGSSALTMQLVAVRAVCHNTVTAALRTASNKVSIRHTKNYDSKVREAQETLGLITAYYDNLQGLMDKLSSENLSLSQAEVLTERLFPVKDEDKEDDVSTRTLNNRNKVIELFQTGQGNRGETKWDYWNGVTEYVSHFMGTRSTGNSESENKFASTMLGNGANLSQRALDLLTA